MWTGLNGAEQGRQLTAYKARLVLYLTTTWHFLLCILLYHYQRCHGPIVSLDNKIFISVISAFLQAHFVKDIVLTSVICFQLIWVLMLCFLSFQAAALPSWWMCLWFALLAWEVFKISFEEPDGCALLVSGVQEWEHAQWVDWAHFRETSNLRYALNCWFSTLLCIF